MQYFRENEWNLLLYVFSSFQSILPCLLFADSLIFWIFHHTPANRDIFPAGVAFIWAFHSGFPIPFKNYPEAIQKPWGIFQLLSYTLSKRAFPVAISKHVEKKKCLSLFSEALPLCLHL
jgi:hypothetical protein